MFPVAGSSWRSMSIPRLGARALVDGSCRTLGNGSGEMGMAGRCCGRSREMTAPDGSIELMAGALTVSDSPERTWAAGSEWSDTNDLFRSERLAPSRTWRSLPHTSAHATHHTTWVRQWGMVGDVALACGHHGKRTGHDPRGSPLVVRRLPELTWRTGEPNRPRGSRGGLDSEYFPSVRYALERVLSAAFVSQVRADGQVAESPGRQDF